MILGSKSKDEVINAVENFPFAPQRFSSKEMPLQRFVCFAKPTMEVLTVEANNPTCGAWVNRATHAESASAEESSDSSDT